MPVEVAGGHVKVNPLSIADSGGGPSVARYGARHISARRIPSLSPASVAARSARSVPRLRAVSPRHT